MNQILCSTGALIGRPNGRNHRLLAEYAGRLHCDGFEFMMYDSWYDKADQVAADVKAMKLNIPVMHCEKRIGQNISRGGQDDWKEALRRFEINCETANQIGAKTMVLHLWDGMISDGNFSNNMRAYPYLERIASEHDILLTVENVVCNQRDPMSHWKELRQEYPSVCFTFDTKMAAFHNQIELLYEEEWRWLWEEDHIRHFHVNDYKGGYLDWDNLKTLPVGTGQVEFERFFRWIAGKKYQGYYTVEATAFDRSGIVNSEMLNQCFDRIRLLSGSNSG